jgi:hypothetical protein
VVGLVVEAAGRLARYRPLGDAVRVHCVCPFWPSYRMLNLDAATRDSLRAWSPHRPDPQPRLGVVQLGLRKVSDPTRARPAQADDLGQVAPTCMSCGEAVPTGVLEIWYRVDGEQRFTKLYSDVPGGAALIQVPPHRTLLYSQNGAPGENGKPGLRLEEGFYRADISTGKLLVADRSLTR